MNDAPAAVLLGAAAFGASALTLFTGFGLGTLLLPFFALVFPVEIAVAATALVHVANNLFKLGLLYRNADPSVIRRFGIPAVAAAFAGALLLARLSHAAPWFEWSLGPRRALVTPLGAVMGALILVFALIDLLPQRRARRVPARWLPLGGLLAGFFGGLSGHQGALRAAFLSPLGMAPAAYVSTQAVLACMVDAARLAVYGASFLGERMPAVAGRGWLLVSIATLGAFAGAVLGARWLPHATVRGVRTLTGALLLLVGAGLASGLL